MNIIKEITKISMLNLDSSIKYHIEQILAKLSIHLKFNNDIKIRKNSKEQLKKYKINP